MRYRSPHADLWARRIRRSRKNVGLSQVEVAYHLGVTQTSVCRWEAGLSTPSDIYRGPLADILGVTAAWLFSYDPDPENGDTEAA